MRFVHVEAAGGILLVAATIVALVWANSPWQASYESFWSTNIRIEIGSYVFDEDLTHVVNDVLMAVFFFVVGMEIKRELVVGELRDRRSVALPAMAALGGMIVPASIYVAFNAGGEGARGWGIPMATDIAFALGVVALLGSRVPSAVKVLLLTLAIVDDIGAIAVIAVFYSDALEPELLLVAAGDRVARRRAAPRRREATRRCWCSWASRCGWRSTSRRPRHDRGRGDGVAHAGAAEPRPRPSDHSDIDASWIRSRRAIDSSTLLHPWTSYFIVPVFALANAGIALSTDAISDPSAVLAGVAVGARRRQAGRRHIVQLVRRPARARPPSRGRPMGTHPRRGVGRRDRVHGLAVHHRPGVRLTSPPGRRQDRDADRFGRGGDQWRDRARRRRAPDTARGGARQRSGRHVLASGDNRGSEPEDEGDGGEQERRLGL